MKNFRDWRDGDGEMAVASPAKNLLRALRDCAEMLPASRQATQQCVVSNRWIVEIRTILIDSPAIRNTLQTTENKQKHPFLIDSDFAKSEARQNSDQLASPQAYVKLRFAVLLSARG
jgi:hypothetical protein